MFNVDDKVVCINANYINKVPNGVLPVLKLGKIYTVKSIQFCMYCGNQKLDVGTYYSQSLYSVSILTHLCVCKNMLTNIINVPCDSTRFIKLEDLDLYLLQMEQEENYEMCEILLKIKQSQYILD